MKNAVAYCRVSTNKEEQLDSLESQQKFFLEYAKRNNYNLVRIYADEGKSGTKIKNRTQLLQLLSDAENNIYDLVLIKDVSRLARNTVDFLTSIRRLKVLGIKVIFVNYDQTSSDSSEFMLTMLSAIAQEESANTSKRVKFGKKQNAEKGKVPNLVFGYDKIAGEYFNLNINESEADIVRKIFRMYVEQGVGTNRIAKELNRLGIRTKRGCNWTQCGITRILTNEIYIGKIVNGKEEVVDFLTGVRKQVPEEKQMITLRPQLQIIDNSIFESANELLNKRKRMFQQTGKRTSEKHVFSKLIYCKECGSVFRRVVRTYKNTYIKWVCTGRNSHGAKTCANDTTISEEELLEHIRAYILNILEDRPQNMRTLIVEYNRRYKLINQQMPRMEDIQERINSLLKVKQKYIELFNNDIITIDELKEYVNKLNSELKMIDRERLLLKKSDNLISDSKYTELDEALKVLLEPDHITNQLLKKIISKITVDECKNIEVYIKQLAGLDCV